MTRKTRRCRGMIDENGEMTEASRDILLKRLIAMCSSSRWHWRGQAWLDCWRDRWRRYSPLPCIIIIHLLEFLLASKLISRQVTGPLMRWLGVLLLYSTLAFLLSSFPLVWRMPNWAASRRGDVGFFGLRGSLLGSLPSLPFVFSNSSWISNSRQWAVAIRTPRCLADYADPPCSALCAPGSPPSAILPKYGSLGVFRTPPFLSVCLAHAMGPAQELFGHQAMGANSSMPTPPPHSLGVEPPSGSLSEPPRNVERRYFRAAWSRQGAGPWSTLVWGGDGRGRGGGGSPHSHRWRLTWVRWNLRTGSVNTSSVSVKGQDQRRNIKTHAMGCLRFINS